MNRPPCDEGRRESPQRHSGSRGAHAVRMGAAGAEGSGVRRMQGGAALASDDDKHKENPMAQKSSVDQLNHFLRGEISAVETYRMALDKLDRGSTARSELETCLQSHQSRVLLLREAIVTAGGMPVESSGPWGVFAKAVEGGARILGDKVAVSALEEGEDHGVKDYRADAADLDATTRALVVSRLAPEQQRTHDRMSSLKKRLSA